MRVVSRRPDASWRGRDFGGCWVVTFAQQINATTGCLLAFGGLDPGAVDVESNAIVARVVVIAAHTSMMAGVASTENLLWLVLGVIVFLAGRRRGVLPIVPGVVFRHCDHGTHLA